MRRWKCKRTNDLLEGEPLIVFTKYEDDNTNSNNRFYDPTTGRGFRKSQTDILMDELLFRIHKRKLEGVDIWDYYEEDDYWWLDRIDDLEWYESEEFLYGKKMESRKKKEVRFRPPVVLINKLLGFFLLLIQRISKSILRL